MSLEKRFNIRPDGLVSKNRDLVDTVPWNMSSCSWLWETNNSNYRDSSGIIYMLWLPFVMRQNRFWKNQLIYYGEMKTYLAHQVKTTNWSITLSSLRPTAWAIHCLEHKQKCPLTLDLQRTHYYYPMGKLFDLCSSSMHALLRSRSCIFHNRNTHKIRLIFVKYPNESLTILKHKYHRNLPRTEPLRMIWAMQIIASSCHQLGNMP